MQFIEVMDVNRLVETYSKYLLDIYLLSRYVLDICVLIVLFF